MQRKKVAIKIIALILATIILYSVARVSISYAVENYLSQDELENQGSQTNNENVEFDVYFDGKNHSNVCEISEANTDIILSLKVKNAGYLRDASITFLNSNFVLTDAQENNNYIQSIDKENNKIILNQINAGDSVEVKLNIAIVSGENVSSSLFSEDVKAALAGTYINNEGKEKSIAAEKIVHNEWNGTATAELEEELTKYIQFANAEKSGLLVQSKVTSKLANNTLPVKSEEILVTVPIIESEKPIDVIVVAKSTEATNGEKDATSFSSNNWNYNNETGIVTINVENAKDESGKIAWYNNVSDEFLITYIYSDKVKNAIEGKEITINLNSESNITAYNNVETKIGASSIRKATQKEQLGDIVDFDISADKFMNKGYMYNNKNAIDANKKETEYLVSFYANIGYAELANKITLNQENDVFITDGEEVSTNISGSNYAYDKAISISKNAFDKILGENGSISILNQEETVIATINKDVQVNENGDYVVNISSLDINDVRIETSKPQAEGTLKINIVKAIKSDANYSEAQISSFNRMKNGIDGLAELNVTNIESKSVKTYSDILLNEPIAKSTISINQENLSTIVKNENVEIKATLENNSIDDKMYINPKIVMVLPEYIETIDYTVNLLYTDELSITDTTIIENADGTRTLTIKTKGTTTKYSVENINKGPTVLITANITLKQITPSKDESIKMEVTSDNGVNMSNECYIKYVAPTGVVTTNTISNYSSNGEDITAISGDEKIAKLEIQSTAKTALLTKNIINNYANSISNVRVLGRTFFKGNKNITTGEDLKSTIDIPLSSKIEIQGIDLSAYTIYYSENGEATENIELASNEWTEEPSDLSKVKSYLIVLNSDYVLNQGDSFIVTYNAQVPAGLEFDSTAYEMYEVLFNNYVNSEIISDVAVSTKLGASTGIGPKVSATAKSDFEENAIVTAGKYIKYTVSIQNTGSEDATNVIASMKLPQTEIENATYTTKFAILEGNVENGIYKEIDDETNNINVGTVKSGEEIDINFYLKTVNASSIVTDMNVNVTITGDKIETPITVTVTNKIKGAIFKTESTSNTIENKVSLEISRDSYVFKTTVSLVDTNSTQENITIEVPTPEGMTYKKSFIMNEEKNFIESEINYSDTAKTVNMKVDKLSGSDKITVLVENSIDALESGVYFKEYTSYIKIKTADIEETSSPITESINRGKLKIEYTSSVADGSYLSVGDYITYNLKITNVGTSLIYYTIKDEVPEELKYISTTYTLNGKETVEYDLSTKNVVTMTGFLESGETVDIAIKMKVTSVEEDSVINNKPTIEYNDPTQSDDDNTIIDEIGEIKNTVVADETDHDARRITGLVWIDTNNNGIREDSENKVSGVTVILYNVTTGNIATDSKGSNLTITTDNEGKYTFKNVPQGNYMVIFSYDSVNYSSTVYKATSATEDTNSDATDEAINLYGENKTVAVTGAITLTQANAYNIDLGIVKNPKFDLKLDKQVTKITVQNSQETATHDYNKNFAKIDLAGKYIDSTTIIVEYKISITNEGAVAGYAKKVIDYLPEGMKFNSELNKDWYVTESGIAYNSSLSNTIINPGETKELTLILTKKMSNDSLGLINNTAEIYEISNDFGLSDTDSIPGNKASNEDDLSSANVVVSLNTGTTVIMTTLTFTIIAIIGVGVFLIKKKVLK